MDRGQEDDLHSNRLSGTGPQPLSVPAHRQQSTALSPPILNEHPLSGPLNRLNAILSLLQPLDRYRTPLCDRECDWDAPISHPKTEVVVLNRLVLNRLAGSTAR